MNREERRRLNKFENKEKEKEKGMKNVKEKSSNAILEETIELTESVKRKRINSIEYSIETERKILENVNILTIGKEILSHLEKDFMIGNIFENGSSQKSVISALSEPKYKKYLDSYLADIEKTKGNDEQSFYNSLVYKDLSINPTEIKNTFKAISNALSVIIHNSSINIIEIDSLICRTYMLIQRLDKLYSLYGYYLNDTDSLGEYTVISTAFEGVKQSFNELIEVICDLQNN